MRIAVFIMTALQASAWLSLILGAVFVRSDAAGDGLARAYAVLATVPLLLFSLPAFVLACRNKAPITATALAGIGMALLVTAFVGL